MVDETVHSDGGADPLGDHSLDVDDPLTSCEAGLDSVADEHLGRWLRSLAIHLDMATATG